MEAERAIDCHAHIIDRDRFPFVAAVGYRPKPQESGTREAFIKTLDANRVSEALLVQPSRYGFDNSAMIDALSQAWPRFKGIAVVDPRITEREICALAERGVVGVRFNLVSHDPAVLNGADAIRLLDRLKEYGWLAQVYAPAEQWCEIGPRLSHSGVKVLVDHFGIRTTDRSTAGSGFRAVLALGAMGKGVVKLSAPFRIAQPSDGYSALDHYVAALVATFGLDRCVWGSDWPFLAITPPVHYGDLMVLLRRWLPDAGDRDRVLRQNPRRLFGY
jgi:predicted TIM-barrel fold metal-dependent hydrolase